MNPTQPITPPTRTVVPPSQALYALALAHQEVFAEPIPKPRLLTLATHSAFETARWASMWCFNFGNIRGTGPGGAWTSIKGASEIIDGKEVCFDVGPENMFAAYKDALAGAREYLRFLGVASKPPRPNRYAKAWDASEAGDLDGFISSLQAGGYFTAGLAHYTKGMRDTAAWLNADGGPLDRFWVTLAEPDRLA